MRCHLFRGKPIDCGLARLGTVEGRDNCRSQGNATILQDLGPLRVQFLRTVKRRGNLVEDLSHHYPRNARRRPWEGRSHLLARVLRQMMGCQHFCGRCNERPAPWLGDLSTMPHVMSAKLSPYLLCTYCKSTVLLDCQDLDSDCFRLSC